MVRRADPRAEVIMKISITRALLTLVALPLLTFCSCKTMHVPFRSLLPAGETPAKSVSTTAKQPASTTALAPSASLADPEKKAGEPAAVVAARPYGPAHRAAAAAAYKPPRLVQPVGYYPG